MTNIPQWEYHQDGTLPEENQIFVFGSNLAGRHGRGAALVAKQRFGAIQGTGRGRMGQSYGIPTKDQNIRTRPWYLVADDISDFIRYAHDNPSERFFITRVGCGLAGFKDFDIAPLFRFSPESCSMPIEWKVILENSA